MIVVLKLLASQSWVNNLERLLISVWISRWSSRLSGRVITIGGDDLDASPTMSGEIGLRWAEATVTVDGLRTSRWRCEVLRVFIPFEAVSYNFCSITVNRCDSNHTNRTTFSISSPWFVSFFRSQTVRPRCSSRARKFDHWQLIVV